GGLGEVRDHDLLPRGRGRVLLLDEALLARIVAARGDPLVVAIAAVGRDPLVRAGDLGRRARGGEAPRGGLPGAVHRLRVGVEGRAARDVGRAVGAGGIGGEGDRARRRYAAQQSAQLRHVVDGVADGRRAGRRGGDGGLLRVDEALLARIVAFRGDRLVVAIAAAGRLPLVRAG